MGAGFDQNAESAPDQRYDDHVPALTVDLSDKSQAASLAFIVDRLPSISTVLEYFNLKSTDQELAFQREQAERFEKFKQSEKTDRAQFLQDLGNSINPELARRINDSDVMTPFSNRLRADLSRQFGVKAESWAELKGFHQSELESRKAYLASTNQSDHPIGSLDLRDKASKEVLEKAFPDYAYIVAGSRMPKPSWDILHQLRTVEISGRSEYLQRVGSGTSSDIISEDAHNARKEAATKYGLAPDSSWHYINAYHKSEVEDREAVITKIGAANDLLRADINTAESESLRRQQAIALGLKENAPWGHINKEYGHEMTGRDYLAALPPVDSTFKFEPDLSHPSNNSFKKEIAEYYGLRADRSWWSLSFDVMGQIDARKAALEKIGKSELASLPFNDKESEKIREELADQLGLKDKRDWSSVRLRQSEIARIIVEETRHRQTVLKWFAIDTSDRIGSEVFSEESENLRKTIAKAVELDESSRWSDLFIHFYDRKGLAWVRDKGLVDKAVAKISSGDKKD